MATYKYAGGTRIEYLQGKSKWAKLITPDLNPNGGKKWKIDLYPNEESLQKINKLKEEGLMNVLKKDDDGYYMTFGRPTEKVMRGQIVAFTPPVILDKDLNITDGLTIGNGSDVTLSIEVYQFNKPGGAKKAIAARLKAVRVDNLVTFERQRDFTDAQKQQTKGLESAPEPIF